VPRNLDATSITALTLSPSLDQSSLHQLPYSSSPLPQHRPRHLVNHTQTPRIRVTGTAVQVLRFLLRHNRISRPGQGILCSQRQINNNMQRFSGFSPTQSISLLNQFQDRLRIVDYSPSQVLQVAYGTVSDFRSSRHVPQPC
jgi:hypothetical protein